MIALLIFLALVVITDAYAVLVIAAQLRAEHHAHRRHRRTK